jgi:hypothetical protein
MFTLFILLVAYMNIVAAMYALIYFVDNHANNHEELSDDVI